MKICTNCNSFPAKTNSTWCKNCHANYQKEYRSRPENKDRFNRDATKRRRQRRKDVIDKYGGKCVCCGESQYEFLSIDHVNGNGKNHRENLRHNLISWLRNNEVSEEFQILCHNCNQAKGHYGTCPHMPED